MPKRIDMSGRRFDRLTVVELITGRTWRCVCDCGNEKNVRGDHLRAGLIRSCGCFHDESSRTSNLKHGHRKTRSGCGSKEYVAWTGIIYRTTNPNASGYEHYGGRGIKMCSRWRDSFNDFLSDMGNCPGSGYSVDRIDVNGDYEPGNCRWATATVQARNVRNRKEYEVDGIKRTLAEWADASGIKKQTIGTRIYQLGWSMKDAISRPVKK